MATNIGDFGFGIRIVIEDWDYGLRLGLDIEIRMGNEICDWGLGFGIEDLD